MVQPECCGLSVPAASCLPQEKHPCRALCSCASPICLAPRSPLALWARMPGAPASVSPALAHAPMPVLESGLAVTSADGAAFTECEAAGAVAFTCEVSVGAPPRPAAVPTGAACAAGQGALRLATEPGYGALPNKPELLPIWHCVGNSDVHTSCSWSNSKCTPTLLWQPYHDVLQRIPT